MGRGLADNVCQSVQMIGGPCERVEVGDVHDKRAARAIGLPGTSGIFRTVRQLPLTSRKSRHGVCSREGRARDDRAPQGSPRRITGSPGGDRFLVFHLRKIPGGEMTSTYMESFERVWDAAVPVPGD